MLVELVRLVVKILNKRREIYEDKDYDEIYRDISVLAESENAESVYADG